MPHGIWKIESRPPSLMARPCPEFLLEGTLIEFRVERLTQKAFEQDRSDELGGSLTLHAPLTDELCGLGLGMRTKAGRNICRNRKLTSSPGQPVVFDEVGFNYSRLTQEEAALPENGFFLKLGAKANAPFVLVSIPHKNVEWRLWLRSRSEMVSECVIDLPGKDNVDSFPMIWRRQAGR